MQQPDLMAGRSAPAPSDDSPPSHGPATAIARIRQAIALDGDNCALHNELGAALIALGEIEEAKKAFLRALQLDPRHVAALLNLADLLIRTQQEEQAATCCRAALHLAPENADAAGRLAVALHRLGRAAEALEHFRSAVRLRPGDAARHDGLGMALLALDRPEEALAAHEAALALEPNRAETHYHRGNTLARLDRLEEAVASFARALELDPRHVAARSALGRALQELGRAEEALSCFDAALAHASDDADIRDQRAQLLLLLGRHEEGWAEHEGSWRASSGAKSSWDGTPQSAATLLLHAERELGDTIQLVRYVAAARRRVGRLILAAPAALHPLLAGLSAIDELIATDGALPSYDIEAPLLALPHLLGEAVGLPPAYLAANAAKARSWTERIGRHGLRVGILRAEDRVDRKRSIPAETLRPLLEREARFFALQPGRCDELAELGLDRFVTDLSPDPCDLADTAALLTALDLSITVDGSIAHLAGALGRPVWLMLPFAPDWRWGQRGSATRWYPQMRLFRQPAPGRWDAVMAEIARELTRLYL